MAALGLLIGGFGLVRGFQQLSDKVDKLERVGVPGARAVAFPKDGDYTVYYEAGLGGNDAALPPIQVTLKWAAGTPVPMRPYTGSFTYEVGGHAGRAVATFHLASAGDYVLSSSGDVPTGVGQLAVGRGLGGVLVATVVPGLVVILALLAALVLAIVTAVRRRRSTAG